MLLAGSTTTTVNQPFTASVGALIAAGIVGLVWVAVLVVVALTNRPPRIRAAAGGGGGIDLPPESPAVAGMLVNDFDLPAETAPAILLDLAARKVVTLEEIRPGQTICRVKRDRGTALTPAEEQVLDAVSAKAIDGIVPTDALSTGTNDQSKKWHRSLGKKVVDESQSAGLTVNRWSQLRVAPLMLGAVIVGILGWIGLSGDDVVEGRDAIVAGIAGGVAVATLVGGVFVVSRWLSSLAQLPTDAGRTQAAVAVGFEHSLGEQHALDDAPPASVIVRGRHLAYAAAFGLAGLAVSLLPMGQEDDRHAWSRFAGKWRRVRVRYPRLVPPAWGKHPALALLLGLAWIGAAVLAYLGADFVRTEAEKPTTTGITTDQLEIVRVAAVVWMVPFVIGALWGAWVIVRAVPDLFRSMTVKGELVRVRRRQSGSTNGHRTYRYYVAIDDGSDETVRAYRVRRTIFSSATQGVDVQAEVTPNLGYVRSVQATAGATAPGTPSA